MPRPNKILEPTKQYNIMLKVEQYDKLAKMATIMQQVSLRTGFCCRPNQGIC
jgi:hypothetical protein